MICITVFAFVQFILYAVEFLLLIVYMIKIPKEWTPKVQIRLP